MVLFKQILCPIDFSEFSRHAFDRAVSIARCYDAGISVLHVLPLPAVVHTVPFGPEGGPTSQRWFVASRGDATSGRPGA